MKSIKLDKKLIKKLGLPKYAKLRGFCVHHVESDEFLYKYEPSEQTMNLIWSQTPELVMLIKNQEEAERIANEINKGCIVAAIFDIGNELAVVTL
ncbi:MAG: hypothetical protein OEW97_02620 [Gammaproteobacteria bacterium]|nr:hypothetical protein [Gammaproteobacteria bacterium]